MKRFLSYLFLFSVLGCVLPACSSDDDNDGPEFPVPDPEEVPEATLSFPQETVTLGGTVNNSNEVSLRSNQRQFGAVVEPSAASWLDVEIEGKILRVKALASNDTQSQRSGKVTVTAGTGSNTKTGSVTITQAIWDGQEEDATLTLTPAGATLEAEAEATQQITLTSNKDVFSVEIPTEAQTWLEASISGTVLTLKAIQKNEAETSRSVVVSVTAGAAPRKTITVTLDVSQKGTQNIPTGTEIGALYGGGAIFFNDGTTLKIISLDAPSVVWGTITDVAVGLSNNNSDGYGNTEMIKAAPGYPDAFPAAKHCADKGEGWFLPSRGELNTFFDAAINRYFEIYEGADPIAASYHWVSNEHATNVNQAFSVRLSDRGAAAYAKTGSRPVRCVKNLPAPTN